MRKSIFFYVFVTSIIMSASTSLFFAKNLRSEASNYYLWAGGSVAAAYLTVLDLLAICTLSAFLALYWLSKNVREKSKLNLQNFDMLLIKKVVSNAFSILLIHAVFLMGFPFFYIDAVDVNVRNGYLPFCIMLAIYPLYYSYFSFATFASLLLFVATRKRPR